MQRLCTAFKMRINKTDLFWKLVLFTCVVHGRLILFHHG